MDHKDTHLNLKIQPNSTLICIARGKLVPWCSLVSLKFSPLFFLLCSIRWSVLFLAIVTVESLTRGLKCYVFCIMYKYYGTINDFFQLNSQSVADMSLNPEVSFN